MLNSWGEVMKSVDIHVAAGVAGAVTKGIKNKFSFKSLCIQIVVGGFVAWLGVYAVNHFLPDANDNLKISAAFITGWVANEVLEHIENGLSDGYELVKIWIKSKIGK